MSLTLTVPVMAARQGLLRGVTIIALVTLPFMTALTIEVGFPLKIYEVALLTAMVLVPFSGRLSFPRRALRGAAVTAAWIGLAGLFLLLRLTFPLETVDTAGLASRFGPVGAGITKFIYLLLDLFAFTLFARFAGKDENGFLKYWMTGAVIAATYSYYLVGMSLVGIENPPLLPGAVSTGIVIASHLFIRCATFQEGNEAGLYFAVSALLAFHGGFRKTGCYLLGAIITTFSTLALVVLVGMLAWQFWRHVGTLALGLRVLVLPLILVVGIGAAAGLIATTVFQTAVVDKLSANSGNEAWSRLERLVFARAAWDMFLDHPLMGVGVAQFGYNFQSYSDYPLDRLPIPNVVYLEFLSEDGLVVFGIFLVFFYMAFRRTRNEVYLRAAFFSLILGFFAYATISVMFVWALFGLLYGRSPAPQRKLADQALRRPKMKKATYP